MPPQFVRSYVKTNKNDAADAEACCEAVQRPSMRFVTRKTMEQAAMALPGFAITSLASNGDDQCIAWPPRRVWPRGTGTTNRS